MASTWMSDLNPQQRQAVGHGEGPLLVIAGAGTGKTKTLACRVAHLIEQGVRPDRILLLTFTRRAAAQMLRRAEHLTTATTTGGKVWGGTFHAIANRLLRQYGQSLGLSPQFTVMDQADAADLMNLIRAELGPVASKRRFPRKDTLMAIYSRSVNSRTPLRSLLEKHFPWCQDAMEGIRGIFERYTQRKQHQNLVDYDDLLLYWKTLCTADAVNERFEHILVDEYQDTNVVQAEILQAMRRTRKNIMVVGDDAQAIYSFRAATVRNILDFPNQYPGTVVVKLEQNYRSNQPILDLSNSVMDEAPERFTKNLYSKRASEQKPALITCMDETEQCAEVCDRVLEKLEQGVALKNQAVLFRAGHHSDQLEIELSRRHIPFVKYGGLKFLESAHVKDLICILRVIENPADQLSWHRVLLLIDGVGPATARRVMDGLLQPVGFDPGGADPDGSGSSDRAPGEESSPLHTLIHRPPAVPPAARPEFSRLRSVVEDCVDADGSSQSTLPVAAQIERIRKFYEPILERLYDNAPARQRDLEQLEQIAGGYTSRRRFLEDLTLDPPSSTQDLAGPPLLDEDYLILSTIHSAKGCEWDAVNIIHAADGMIPSDMATGNQEEIDEERRLLYVAMTRPRDTLNIFFPLRYYRRGKGTTDQHSYAQLTRFIPRSALDQVDRITAHGARQEEDCRESGLDSSPLQSVHAMLHELWRC